MNEVEGPSYNVYCRECEQVLIAHPGMHLWWKAKKREEAGFLDAYACSGVECGCVEKQLRPEAPFRVMGYTDQGREFDIPLDTFTAVVHACRELVLCTIFVKGVSQKVCRELEFC